jgi:hypothetical protein
MHHPMITTRRLFVASVLLFALSLVFSLSNVITAFSAPLRMVSVPAGVRAVLAEVWVRDSDSAATDVSFVLGPASGITAHISKPASPNDRWEVQTSTIPCDANGDLYFFVNASGTLTMDVFIRIHGYFI